MRYTALSMTTILLMLCNVFVVAQESMHSDTSGSEELRKPHILHVEILGRGGYWNIGYGYSFIQRKNHEFIGSIGINFMYYEKPINLA
jgi:hypothetical protein